MKITLLEIISRRSFVKWRGIVPDALMWWWVGRASLQLTSKLNYTRCKCGRAARFDPFDDLAVVVFVGPDDA